MGSHNYGEQSISASSFKPDVSEALRNRQGCEVAHALKGMSAGEQMILLSLISQSQFSITKWIKMTTLAVLLARMKP